MTGAGGLDLRHQTGDAASEEEYKAPLWCACRGIWYGRLMTILVWAGAKERLMRTGGAWRSPE